VNSEIRRSHEGGPSDFPSRETVRDAAFSGVRWFAIERVVVTLTTLASAVALARLLTPAEFGHSVIAFVVLAVSGTVAHAGVTVPLVQRQMVSAAHLQAAGVIAVGAAVLFTGFTLLFGATLAVGLFGTESARLLRLAAGAFVLTALAAVGQALLQRRLEFGRMALLSSAQTVCASLIAVALAATGVGAAALVLGPLAASALTAALVFAMVGGALPRWRGPEARELLRFGLLTFGSGLLKVGWKNVDYAVVAARLDAAAVGIYWRAYTIGVQDHRILSGIVTPLALPLYARLEARHDRLGLRRRVISLQSLVAFPLLGGLILMAPILLPFALGEAWEPAVRPTQILAVAGMAGVLQAGTTPLIIALGRPGVLLGWNLSSLLMLGVVTFAFAPLGLVWLSVAVTAFYIVRVAVGQELLVRRIAGTALGELSSSCLPALVSTAVMVAGGAGLLIGADALGLPEWAAVISVAPLAAVIYFGVLATAFPRGLASLREAVTRVMRGRGGRMPLGAEGFSAAE
jgi:O-antigen/teichoic acid export membrane protein